MNTAPSIFSNEKSVEERLQQLGLSQEHLKFAVAQGQAARNSSTPNHPANAGGTMAFLETVKALRDSLLPEGWAIQNVRNLSMTINPETNMAIVVSGGSNDTGLIDGYPTTRNPKGHQTKQYLSVNQKDLFQDNVVSLNNVEDDSTGQTWLLLYCFDEKAQEIRSELSLPTNIDSLGRVCGWNERILLKSIPLDGELIDIEPDFAPEIDIDIERQA